jgi:phosphatidate cytidylyltransferase
MFDVLDVHEHVADEESDIEEPEPEPEAPASSGPAAPLSKSAKKRARAKAAAAARANGTNGDSAEPPAVAEAQPEPVKLAPEVPQPASTSAPAAATSAAPAPAATAPAQPREASPPTSPTFAPSLPESLPQPARDPSPANRKRKAPSDFTPAGPGAAFTPSSPSKNSVKFEDGVVPGEGREGEKVLPRVPEPVQVPVPKKNQNAIERTVWTLIMIFGFITLLLMGHPCMIILVMVCQALVYKEITALFDLRDQGSKTLKPAGDWSKTLNWYFFVVTNYFLYGESIIYYFKHIVFVDAYFVPFAKNHRFISFMLYILGFVAFVANLQRQYLRQQFALFCWVHITLLLIVVSSHFIVNNILEGMIWFFVPASLVICNDIFAYICGKLFGRTQLIKLSPKKTVEGFVGAFICTLIFGIGWGTFFQQFNYFICPAKDLGVTFFSDIQCKPNPVFLWKEYEWTGAVRTILSTILGHEPGPVWYKPYQLHVIAMATFASLVAPFGGFFASGFKRAFNIKDFGHSIPGHGGMTDRMDCQFMMGIFAYVYYSSLIRVQNVSVGSILQTVVVSLTTTEQLELLNDLKRYLSGQGVAGL